MPYSYSPRIIRHATAQIAADLHSLKQDLDHVAQCAKVRSTLSLVDRDSLVLTRALTTSALIAYRRCFGTGDRTRIREQDLFTLTPEEIDVHRMALALADKAHAHPVASNETSVMGVMVGLDEDGNMKRGGFHCGGHVSFDAGGAWLSLLGECACKISSDVVQAKIIEAQEALSEWLDQFSIQEIALWESSFEAITPGPNVLNRRRKSNLG